MKNRISVLIGLFLICSLGLSSQETETKDKVSGESLLNVVCSPDLYNLTVKWAAEYSRQNSAMKINVINLGENASKSILTKEANLGFISGHYYASHKEGELWKMNVGRDVYVPVFNSGNPYANEIIQKGISPQKLSGLFKNKSNNSWNMLLENGAEAAINFYVVDNNSVLRQLESFLDIKQNAVVGIKVVNGAALIAALQNDPNGIGFCKLNDILDSKSQTLADKISLLPIDKNGNGKIDFVENIYTDINDFSRGLWVGKFPRTLMNNIYSVSSVKPTQETETAFLKWILNDGQQYLNEFGYTDLVLSERQTLSDQLNNEVVVSDISTGYNKIFKSVLIILAVIILGGLIAVRIIHYFRKGKKSVPATLATVPAGFNENSLQVPGGLYYDKTHTWAFMEENGSVKVGIDDFMQHVTGTLTRIEMKEPGERIKKGEKLATIIQKGKQLDIYSPVSGTIREQNRSLAADTSLLNTSPYSGGWVYMIEPDNWLREINLMSMAGKYTAWLKNEVTRLKDFVAASVKPELSEYSLILQDGGEIKDNLLEDLGPEVWEDFQEKFIDTSK